MLERFGFGSGGRPSQKVSPRALSSYRHGWHPQVAYRPFPSSSAGYGAPAPPRSHHHVDDQSERLLLMMAWLTSVVAFFWVDRSKGRSYSSKEASSTTSTIARPLARDVRGVAAVRATGRRWTARPRCAAKTELAPGTGSCRVRADWSRSRVASALSWTFRRSLCSRRTGSTARAAPFAPSRPHVSIARSWLLSS